MLLLLLWLLLLLLHSQSKIRNKSVNWIAFCFLQFAACRSPFKDFAMPTRASCQAAVCSLQSVSFAFFCCWPFWESVCAGISMLIIGSISPVQFIISINKRQGVSSCSVPAFGCRCLCCCLPPRPANLHCFPRSSCLQLFNNSTRILWAKGQHSAIHEIQYVSRSGKAFGLLEHPPAVANFVNSCNA